ncbi:MAG TPA: peptide ABC transporter permease, partial [Candidatus Sulfotelmatobacter sp.]|nr:peptide ABC transporter permease [Candidatus Sulfotelmatobacter sp.]
MFVVLALFAPVLAPYNPDDILESQIQGPSLRHLFGTDDLGRDILSRTLYGARISLSVGLVAVIISVLI